MAFSHVSTRLASASDDRAVKIWDPSSGACVQTLEVGTGLHTVTCCLMPSAYIFNTEIGVIALDASILSTTSTEVKSKVPRYENLGLGSDNAWITYNSEDILLLPSEYRPSSSVVSSKTIAMGVGSGNVWIYNCNIDNGRDSVQ